MVIDALHIFGLKIKEKQRRKVRKKILNCLRFVVDIYFFCSCENKFDLSKIAQIAGRTTIAAVFSKCVTGLYRGSHMIF